MSLETLLNKHQTHDLIESFNSLEIEGFKRCSFCDNETPFAVVEHAKTISFLCKEHLFDDSITESLCHPECKYWDNTAPCPYGTSIIVISQKKMSSK